MMEDQEAFLVQEVAGAADRQLKGSVVSFL
jgi:hypothetical protein